MIRCYSCRCADGFHRQGAGYRRIAKVQLINKVIAKMKRSETKPSEFVISASDEESISTNALACWARLQPGSLANARTLHKLVQVALKNIEDKEDRGVTLTADDKSNLTLLRFVFRGNRGHLLKANSDDVDEMHAATISVPQLKNAALMYK